ncbi:TetR/AcrR family transcriptional regulator [Trujillonella endophytica]|uniref:Transcriptional regulator, TetR family n=1 Tax=Trujillonella endophytica TaxID=673521 RepID=A0A1H8Q4K8_9ACTN|nr:TetR/AcrR family transcriptional regulator [Trujillella endophytica]SEO48901.1 transcriptional regulator, TetR family [Trujillella endophytica]
MQQRQPNQRGAGGRLRLELLDAAFRVLDRSPASGLSLRMVAREAGVAPPSVYDHFPDARTLMADVVRECWQQLGDAMRESAGRPAEQEPLAVLKEQMSAYVAYAMQRPSRYQLLFALQPLDAEAARDLPGPVQPAYRNVLECVEAMLAAGRSLPAADAHTTVLLVLSIAHGRIALAQTAPHRPGNFSAGVQRFVSDVLDRIFAA